MKNNDPKSVIKYKPETRLTATGIMLEPLYETRSFSTGHV